MPVCLQSRCYLRRNCACCSRVGRLLPSPSSRRSVFSSIQPSFQKSVTRQLQVLPSTSSRAPHGQWEPENHVSDKSEQRDVDWDARVCFRSSFKAPHSGGPESPSSSDSESSSRSDSDGDSAAEEPPTCPGSSSTQAEVSFTRSQSQQLVFFFL